MNRLLQYWPWLAALLMMFFICSSATAQDTNKTTDTLYTRILLPDTMVVLEEVWVETSHRSELLTGHPEHDIDSLALENMSGQHLGMLLSRYSGMFIKSYGPVSLSTTSLRGGSAGHTALLWNGFNLQSPMHQQNDLSLLPVFFIDQLSIQHGGSSTILGSGAMGGAVSIQNSAPEKQGLSLMAGISGGSNRNLGQHFAVSFRKNQVATSLKVFSKKAANNYRYRDPAIDDSPVMVQENAAQSAFGFLEENYFDFGSRHKLKLRLWWQENERNIPPALHQVNSAAFQKDENLRITGEWQSNLNKLIAFWRSALLNESIHYTDSLGQNSKSRSSSVIQEGEVRMLMPAGWIIYSGLNLQIIKADSDEYLDVHTENVFSLFASASWQDPSERIKTVLSLRQELIRGMEIPLVPSAAVSWRVGRTMSVSANIGKNYRVPSINDRFWVPGGNPDLKPESGWSQDITASYIADFLLKRISPYFSSGKLSSTFFNRNINNWIIWLPDQSGQVWTPQNIMKVKSHGIETRASLDWQRGNLLVRTGLNWDYIISKNVKAKSLNDASVGKQLIYVPANKVLIFTDLALKSITISYSQQYTGKRFISADNSRWLDPYTTGDITLSWTGNFNQHAARIFISAINIWNESYFAVASRPMPLRYIEAGLNFHFFKR